MFCKFCGKETPGKSSVCPSCKQKRKSKWKAPVISAVFVLIAFAGGYFVGTADKIIDFPNNDVSSQEETKPNSSSSQIDTTSSLVSNASQSSNIQDTFLSLKQESANENPVTVKFTEKDKCEVLINGESLSAHYTVYHQEDVKMVIVDFGKPLEDGSFKEGERIFFIESDNDNNFIYYGNEKGTAKSGSLFVGDIPSENPVIIKPALRQTASGEYYLPDMNEGHIRISAENMAFKTEFSNGAYLTVTNGYHIADYVFFEKDETFGVLRIYSESKVILDIFQSNVPNLNASSYIFESYKP